METSVWNISPDHPEAETLAGELSIPRAIAQILVNRKIKTAEAAREYLFGGLEGLHDPFLMKGMAEAVDRIMGAIGKGEKILIFGDYDVDGVLSVVMLFKAIRSLGGEVEYFIPERLRDGYGIKDQHVDVPVERGTKLVISVDCGIKAVGFAEKARARGVDVIITDHHQPGDVLPAALAVLNPVLEDSGYPDRGLAGVGVTFKLIQALLGKSGKARHLPHYMKLVCIGTVADVAELKGENRLFVKYGLKGLGQVNNTGLKSLIDACGLGQRRITEGDLGFRIGPRINAAGRMGMTDLAVRLFFSETAEEAVELVQQLETLNSKRQKTEEDIFESAKEFVEERGLHRKYKCLVLGSEAWHRGVIGIVASKLKDRYHRPVILFSHEDGKAYGSGRSISEVPLIDLIEACREYLVNFGGSTT
jgi:single-stranded-DNA-specific exonuclease